jgi:hypothetical protein
MPWAFTNGTLRTEHGTPTTSAEGRRIYTDVGVPGSLVGEAADHVPGGHP